MRKISLICVGIAIIAIAGVLLYPQYKEWSYQQKAKQAITAKLIDPTSPLFSNFTNLRTVPEGLGKAIMRVNVNAKNSFGGYIGAKAWVVTFDGKSGSVTHAEPEEEWRTRLITELMQAASNNTNPEVVTALINGGADVNARDSDGSTALMREASNNTNPEVTMNPLDGGTDVNAKNRIREVRNNSNPEVTTALISGGADVDARGFNDATALMWAAINNTNPEIVAALINAGADVEAKDRANGATVLMWAARNNTNPEIITALIRNGADVNARNQDGARAIDFAVFNVNLRNTEAYRELRRLSN